MNTFNLTLDLAKAKQRQQQTIFLRQGDKNATTIRATITDHGVAASTSGMTARFQMRLPNGTEYYRKTATLSGNTATVTIDEAQAASAVGRTDVAYFQLLQGSTVVASTESFTVIVLPDALADATVPESYDSAIQDAIDALDDAVEQLPATVEDVLADHPEWITVQDGSITDIKLVQTGGVLSEVHDIRTGADGTIYASAGDAVRGQITKLAVFEPNSENIFNDDFTVGEQVATSSGNFVAGPNYARTDHIPIKAGVVNIGVKTTTTQPWVAIHYCLYDENKTKLVAGYGNAITVNAANDMQYQTLTATQDGYVAFDIYSTNAGRLKYYVSQVDSPTGFVPYYEGGVYVKESVLERPNAKLASMTYGKSPSQAAKATLSNGETMVAESNSIKKNHQVVFFAKIGTFDTIYVGHGQGEYGYYIAIDSTNMTYMTNGTSGTSIAHGLTISDYILVIIDVDKVLNAKITIATMGGTFTKTQGGWTGTKGEVFAKSIGSTLTDAVLTWSSDDYKKACWAFGDSYFATNTNTRWPYWVVTNWGYDNVLLNAYPGEASENAYNDLLAALEHGTPKYLLWCLGMNDHDTSSAANATWLEKVELIEELCEEKGITLILATIPNVTNTAYNNTYKNQYVEASGYRYINFADAVNGVDGWLSVDGVHPNEYGARLLAAKAIIDCPELLQSC